MNSVIQFDVQQKIIIALTFNNSEKRREAQYYI